jgi:hypothetical protein
MLSLSLSAGLTLFGALACVVAVYAMATRTDILLDPATVDPFKDQEEHDPSADTLAGLGAEVPTTPPAATGGWQLKVLSNLSQVEDLLDSLEAHGVAEREVVTLGGNCFAVRWR